MLAASLLLIIHPASPPVAAASKPDKDQERLNKTLQKHWDKLHPNAKRGATPEAKAAWDSLKPEHQAAIKRLVHRTIAKEKKKFEKNRKDQQANLKSWNDVIAKEKKDGKEGEDTTLTYVGAKGKRQSINAKKRDGGLKPNTAISGASAQNRTAQPKMRMVKASASKSQPEWGAGWQSAPSSVPFKKASLLKTHAGAMPDDVDADGDGTPDSFENALADAFTPTYHVSQSETDNFSTFEDYVPQTVKGRFGQTPISHFRVVPLGIKTNNLT